MSTSGTSRRSWRALFGVGELPGSEQERRDYLARRVALYFSVLFVIYSLRYCTVVLLGVLENNLAVALLTPGRIIHVLAILVVFSAWRFALGVQRTIARLAWVDGLGTLSISVAFGAFAIAVPNDQRAFDLTLLLVLTQTLVARAAIVPSTATRTLTVGFASVVVLSIAMYIQGSAAQPSSGVPAWNWTFHTIEWGGISVILTSIISRVIYGLQRRVEQVASLGQYTLIDKIGEGSMGIVYRARHGMLRRPTAIKLLPPERAGGSRGDSPLRA